MGEIKKLRAKGLELRVKTAILSFWLVQNPSEERFPSSGNDNHKTILL
jgi:hypothetical protein